MSRLSWPGPTLPGAIPGTHITGPEFSLQPSYSFTLFLGGEAEPQGA